MAEEPPFSSGPGPSAHPRVGELIRALKLQPHAEGGHFAEVFRSPRLVRAVRPAGAGGAPEDGGGGRSDASARERSALTTIYFLLAAGETSRWHRLDADEIWHFIEGEPLDLLLLDERARILTRLRLGPAAPGAGGGAVAAPVHVVPAGSWLAARPSGAYSLVGCTVGPGFEYEGFTLLRDVPVLAEEVARRFPDVAPLV